MSGAVSAPGVGEECERKTRGRGEETGREKNSRSCSRETDCFSTPAPPKQTSCQRNSLHDKQWWWSDVGMQWQKSSCVCAIPTPVPVQPRLHHAEDYMWPRTGNQTGLQGACGRRSAPRPRVPPATTLRCTLALCCSHGPGWLLRCTHCPRPPARSRRPHRQRAPLTRPARPQRARRKHDETLTSDNASIREARKRRVYERCALQVFFATRRSAACPSSIASLQTIRCSARIRFRQDPLLLRLHMVVARLPCPLLAT